VGGVLGFGLRMFPVACKISTHVNIKGSSSWLEDHPLVPGPFEVPAKPLDCISMWLLWIGRKAGALVHGIGDVQLGALLKIVELADDAPVVKTVLVVKWHIVMAT